MGNPRRWSWLTVTVIVVGLFVWILIGHDTEEQKSPGFTSLAVLPFTPASHDAELAQLAGGLSLDLSLRLQALGNLQISPGNLVSTRRMVETPLHLLARQLGAEILVLGNVGQQSGRVLLALNIVNAYDGTSVSRVELIESRERIFDLQQQAAHAVADALQIPVRGSEKARLRKNPSRSLKAWYYFIQGQTYLQDVANPRGPSFAADLFRRAIQHDPDFAQAHVGLSEALWIGHSRYGDPGNLVEAELEARWILSQDPDMGPAAVVLAKIVQTAARSPATRSQGVPEVDRLAKPDEAWREVATGLLQVGRLELAEAALRTAVNLGGDSWINPYCLGQFLLRGGRYGEAAIALADAASKSPPKMTWSRESLAKLKLATGDISGAIGVFETLEQPLADPETIRQVGAAYVMLDRLQSAELLYRQALALDPENAKVHRELGDVLSRQGRQDEAEELYARGLQILLERNLDGTPTDPAMELRLAVLAAKARDCARALPLASTLRRHLEQSAEASHDLAQVFALCGDTEMAIDTLRVALSLGLDPGRVRSEPEFQELASEAGLQAILAEAEGIPPAS